MLQKTWSFRSCNSSNAEASSQHSQGILRVSQQHGHVAFNITVSSGGSSDVPVVPQITANHFHQMLQFFYRHQRQETALVPNFKANIYDRYVVPQLL